MRIGRVTTVTIGLILQLTAHCVSSLPVSIYVKLEASSLNYVHVNFYNNTFQRLYQCMRDANSQQCFVQTEYETYGTPFPGQNCKVTNVTSNGISQLAESSFTCLFNQSLTALECTRNRGQCGGNTRCTYFHLSNSPICECVYLIWRYPNENLVFDNKTDNIEYCKQDCTKTTTAQSTESRSYESLSSLTSEQSSNITTSTSNSTNFASTGGDESSSTVPVIIGVVLGVLCIAAIVLVVAFIYRRKKQNKGHVSNKGNNSFPTHTIYNGGPVRNNASNIPDVLSTLPYSSHGSETNRESEDGYYSIDKVYGFNRYENGLNTISSKASHRPDEGVVTSRGLNNYTNDITVSPDTQFESNAGNSEISCALEGDYFTIDTENDQKLKAVESVLSSHQTHKYTNERRVSPETHTFQGDADISEMSQVLEGDYFTIDTENDQKHKAVESVLSSHHTHKYTNERRVSPDTHTYESDAGNSEMSHVLEGDYFTIDTEKDDGEKHKAVPSVLNSHHLPKYTNELRVTPQTLQTYAGEDFKSEPLHAPEEEYFTLETENDFDEDETSVDEEQTTDGGYSLARDVDITDEAAVIEVIDVSPPPKSIYSKFGDNDNTDLKNPYDKLLEKHQILQKDFNK